MLLAIIFVNVWGVLQLVALGSFARTVRVRTVLAAIVTGVFFCAPVAALVEYGWTTAVAALTGSSFESIGAVAGYTLDPPLEEIIRILPLAVAMTFPAFRRQSSVTDCVLVGAAAGAGFGLAEDLYRFGTAPQYATAIDEGWVFSFRPWVGASHATSVFVPDIGASLLAWLPDLGGLRTFPPSVYLLPNVLLIWSAVAGLAVGLFVHVGGARRWSIAAALLLFVSADHAASNADITLGQQLITAPMRAIREVLPLFPLAALAVAWWFDRRRMNVSPGAAWERAFERIDGWRVPGAWTRGVATWTQRACETVKRPATIVSSMLTLPAVLWFVVGGWPATSGVQRMLSAGIGAKISIILSAAAYAWLLWRLAAVARRWPALTRVPASDSAAIVALRTTSAIGLVVFGGYALARGLGIWPAAGALAAAHVLDAIQSLLFPQLAPFINGGAPMALPAGMPLALPGTPLGAPWGPASGAGPGSAPGALPQLGERMLPSLGPRAPVVVAASAAAGAGLLGAAAAYDHAGEVGSRPDPDVVSPPGGAPPLDDQDVRGPTYPAPEPELAPTVPPPVPVHPDADPEGGTFAPGVPTHPAPPPSDADVPKDHRWQPDAIPRDRPVEIPEYWEPDLDAGLPPGAMRHNLPPGGTPPDQSDDD